MKVQVFSLGDTGHSEVTHAIEDAMYVRVETEDGQHLLISLDVQSGLFFVHMDGGTMKITPQGNSLLIKGGWDWL